MTPGAASLVRRADVHLDHRGGPEQIVQAVPPGFLAFWNAEHVLPDGGDPFFRDIQEVYDEIGEGVPHGTPWPRPGELEERRDEIEAGRLFEVVHIRHFDWERVCDADGYIELLNTFSGHIAMAAWQRDRLYGEIRRRLRIRPDGRVRRHWERSCTWRGASPTSQRGTPGARRSRPPRAGGRRTTRGKAGAVAQGLIRTLRPEGDDGTCVGGGLRRAAADLGQDGGTAGGGAG